MVEKECGSPVSRLTLAYGQPISRSEWPSPSMSPADKTVPRLVRSYNNQQLDNEPQDGTHIQAVDGEVRLSSSRPITGSSSRALLAKEDVHSPAVAATKQSVSETQPPQPNRNS